MKTIFLALIMAFTFAAITTNAMETVIPYQGRIAVQGSVFTGVGQFRFSLTDDSGSTVYWRSDAGSGIPVNVDVLEGDFEVKIGDASINNMADIPISVFSNNPLFLHVWFSDGSGAEMELTPATRLLPVPYAVVAGTVEDGAITAGKLATGAVQFGNIANGAVGEAQLFNAAVTANAMAPNAVGTDVLIDKSVTCGKLADGSVRTNHIAAGNVKTSHLADGAVTSSKLAIGAVDSQTIKNGGVTVQDIENGAVTENKIAQVAISTSKIQDSAVTSNKIAYGAINVELLKHGVINESINASGGDVCAESSVTTPLVETETVEAFSVYTTDVIADKYRYNQPKQGSVYVNGASFIPYISGVDASEAAEKYFIRPRCGFLPKYFNDFGINAVEFFAPVNLPQNARVTSMDFHFEILWDITDEPDGYSVGMSNSIFKVELFRQPTWSSSHQTDLRPERVVGVAPPTTTITSGGGNTTTVGVYTTNNILGVVEYSWEGNSSYDHLLLGFSDTADQSAAIDRGECRYFLKMTWSDRWSVNTLGSLDGIESITGVRIRYEQDKVEP